MIARLWGRIIEKNPSYIILRSGDIGFEILISARTYQNLPPEGQDSVLDIYTHIREDCISLVGFISLTEKLVFLKLLEVNGVSIKIALSAFSLYDTAQIKKIIRGKEIDLLKRVPGIGKKLAERILLELSEKFDGSDEIGPILVENKRLSEVKQALRSLGYKNSEIEKALKNMDAKQIEENKIEDILKSALKEV